MRRAVRGTPEATVTTEALLMRRAVRGTYAEATEAMLRRCDVQRTEAMRESRLCAMSARRRKTRKDD